MADLPQIARRHLDLARQDEHGRSAELLIHDGVLRQTVIALVAGAELAEHNTPHAATLQVLAGHVRLTGVPEPDVTEGTLALLTHDRHGVAAVVDSVFLLTTVTSVPPQDEPARAR
ncbi:cupin domain-containing protein [Cellulomonas bogoriensis]|uniref:Cupin n=1 Tax=Cellulomonas bogoriensis 69B4 = DSM 16987 TaxID=1386082 RepID=A0A0A0BN66_9CELL|nr:cupin [Cellulomonas bogoriensis]KGM08514.1 cupin [Cellulomonas bogoriensis 69B4 = DSM 16987]